VRRGVASGLPGVGAPADDLAPPHDYGAYRHLARLPGPGPKLERQAQVAFVGTAGTGLVPAQGGTVPESAAITWSCTRPLLDTALPPSRRRSPAKSLNFPPASSTIT
jgi:hypothetical protein